MTAEEFWTIVIVIPLAFLLADVLGAWIGTYIRFRKRKDGDGE